jgi:hypothetical protein
MDSLGNIKNNNIAFHLNHEGKFLEFIRENLRPQPAVYAEIRQVNAALLAKTEEEQDHMDLGKNECGASHYGKAGESAESMRQSQ